MLLSKIPCDNSRDNIPKETVDYSKAKGIEIKNSPEYARHSNGSVERLAQEHWTPARIQLLAINLPSILWGEAIHQRNWIRNRSPNSRINNNIPIFQWNQRTTILFMNILLFGARYFSFIYIFSTSNGKIFLPCSELSHFVSVESDSTLIRMFLPLSNSLCIVRQADVLPITKDALPPLSNFIYGHSRQNSIKTSL